MSRDEEEVRLEREADFEALRAEKLRDKADLERTARDYLNKNLFDGQAKNTVTSILGKYQSYGETGMTEKMWSALAGCVAYVEISDQEQDE